MSIDFWKIINLGKFYSVTGWAHVCLAAIDAKATRCVRELTERLCCSAIAELLTDQQKIRFLKGSAVYGVSTRLDIGKITDPDQIRGILRKVLVVSASVERAAEADRQTEYAVRAGKLASG